MSFIKNTTSTNINDNLTDVLPVVHIGNGIKMTSRKSTIAQSKILQTFSYSDMLQDPESTTKENFHLQSESI